MTDQLYELQQPVTVKVRMFDSATGHRSSATLQAGAGLRAKFLRMNHRKGVVVLQPIGDPATEIETTKGTWGRWKPLGVSGP